MSEHSVHYCVVFFVSVPVVLRGGSGGCGVVDSPVDSPVVGIGGGGGSGGGCRVQFSFCFV